MTRKLKRVWLLALVAVLFSAFNVYADDDFQGNFFIKNVIINGEKIVNYNLQYAIVIYNESMYIPLTEEMCEIYGLETDYDKESRTLKLFNTESARKNLSDNRLKNDVWPMLFNVLTDAKVHVYEKEGSFYVFNTLEKVETAELYLGELDLMSLPLLENNNIIYMPLRALAENEYLGWDIHFDEYFGVCISTDPDIPAKTYFDYGEALENRGLVNYMMRINSTIVPSYGQQLVFLFKRAGEVYGVDPKLLVAVVHTESRFNTGAVGRGGSAGLMQVMPATAARYGMTAEQLKDPKKGIDFGAMYISERIEAFNGDWILGLSAYNQGTTRVNRGSHSITYANLVMSRYENIEKYLLENGFIL